MRKMNIALIVMPVALFGCHSLAGEYLPGEQQATTGEMHTFTRTDVGEMKVNSNEGPPAHTLLIHGITVRYCRLRSNSPSECRYIVPADPMDKTVTVYDDAGLSAYGPDSWTRPSAKFYVNKGLTFRVCPMPVVTDSKQKPKCDELSPPPPA
ncbi:hypothetical protein BH11PAT2_BH11PAT2_07710 [soil metagenome]